jgi:hypothetical protein
LPGRGSSGDSGVRYPKLSPGGPIDAVTEPKGRISETRLIDDRPTDVTRLVTTGALILVVTVDGSDERFAAVSDWVTSACTAVTDPSGNGLGGGALYDCASAASAASAAPAGTSVASGPTVTAGSADVATGAGTSVEAASAGAATGA